MKSAVIDITSLAGIESFFQSRIKDPWSQRLAGNLVDLMVFSDEMIYPLASTNTGKEPPSSLNILKKLHRRNSAAIRPLTYSTEEIQTVSEDYLGNCLAQFLSWCCANPIKSRQWMRLHQEAWIKCWHDERFPHLYSFDIHKLANWSIVQKHAVQLGVPIGMLLYTFDVVLRYPMLGKLAGIERPYLNHPIRDVIVHPTITDEKQSNCLLAGTLSFSKTIEAMLPHLSFDEYTVLIHELRGTVRELGIHRAKPGNIERDVIRELAAKVALPPKIGHSERRLALAAGLIGGISSLPAIGPIGPILGVGISIAQCYWNGELPRSVSRIRWLRWSISWDIETQANE